MKIDIIRFEEVKKNFSNIEALKGVSFAIPDNSIFGIIGANGSGKSTLMKILPGLIKKWSGNIFYKNQLVGNDSIIMKKEFGYLIEAPTFYEYLSGFKNLELLARISQVSHSRILYLLDLVGLKNRAYDKVSSYSYGMKQRLGIAQVLLHDPKVIILDEPNNGLDPIGIADMEKLVKKMHSEGKTVILSTHNLRDVENMCTHFTVFKKGSNSATTSINDLFDQSEKWRIVVDDSDLALQIINDNESITLIDKINNRLIVKSDKKLSPFHINKLLRGLSIYSIGKESNLIKYFYDN